MADQVTPEIIDRIVELIPGAWLGGDASLGGSQRHRAAYVEYLKTRLEPPRDYVEEAIRARSRYI